jgi:ribosomal protein L29
MIKMSEIKDLSVPELKRRLTDEEENLANLRFQASWKARSRFARSAAILHGSKRSSARRMS